MDDHENEQALTRKRSRDTYNDMFESHRDGGLQIFEPPFQKPSLDDYSSESHEFQNVITKTSVAVVGTAGRGKDTIRMNKKLYESMKKRAISIIEDEWKLKWENVELVSGGAAWSDHIAVSLYLEKWSTGVTLRLFMPCLLDKSGVENPVPKFHDNKNSEWWKNPGRSANFYHDQFSKALGHQSFLDIQRAIKLGAILDFKGSGFKQRNLKIAESDSMMAFSWGDAEPSSNGTKHAWLASKSAQKIHISLNSLS